MTNSSHPNHTSQTEPTPSPADAPEIIRYLDTAESLLSRRNPEELRRYLWEAIEPNELRNRQNRLLTCSTEALAVWHDHHQVDANDMKGGSAKVGTPMRVQIVAWPMVLTLSQSAQIRNVFDCRQGHGPSLQMR